MVLKMRIPLKSHISSAVLPRILSPILTGIQKRRRRRRGRPSSRWLIVLVMKMRREISPLQQRRTQKLNRRTLRPKSRV